MCPVSDSRRWGMSCSGTFDLRRRHRVVGWRVPFHVASLSLSQTKLPITAGLAERGQKNPGSSVTRTWDHPIARREHYHYTTPPAGR